MTPVILPEGTAQQVTQQQAVLQLRLATATAILGQLAAFDFADSVRTARDQAQVMGQTDAMQFQYHPGMTAHAALAYADALLMTIGILEPPKKEV